MAAVLAEHQGLEPATGVEFDDDAVDRCGHAARAPETREVGGLGEAPPHKLARRAEDPPVDEPIVVHWFSRSCKWARCVSSRSIRSDHVRRLSSIHIGSTRRHARSRSWVRVLAFPRESMLLPRWPYSLLLSGQPFD